MWLDVLLTASTSQGSPSTSESSDRGVIHQLFLDLKASPSLAHAAQIYLAGPLKVVLIVAIAFLLTRVVSRLSSRMVNSLRLVSPVVKATPRGSARVKTLGGAFTQLFRGLIWVIAFLEILNQFNIDLTPFVATATVIGAAVGFGAQSLVKDFLSGILLLAEDQFGVGDHIAIGTGSSLTSGTVESVNLRVTRLRGADGGILYVPNGDIRTLSNDTETDSQALVDVVVPFGTDLDLAGRAAQAAARGMAAEEDWAPEFVGEPFFAGVQDANNGNGFVLRVMCLTRPGQHLRLAREMRMRIIERIRAEGIAWAPDTPGDPGVLTARVHRDPPIDRAPEGRGEGPSKARQAEAATVGAKSTGKSASRSAKAVKKAIAKTLAPLIDDETDQPDDHG